MAGLLVGIGSDLVAVPRIQSLLAGRFCRRFLQRAFHPLEIALCFQRFNYPSSTSASTSTLNNSNASTHTNHSNDDEIDLANQSHVDYQYGAQSHSSFTSPFSNSSSSSMMFDTTHDDRSASWRACQFLAARWAAKEATYKVLSYARTKHSEPILFNDIVVLSDDDGRPRVELQGSAIRAANLLQVGRTHISLAHDSGYAMATVMMERIPNLEIATNTENCTITPKLSETDESAVRL